MSPRFARVLRGLLRVSVQQIQDHGRLRFLTVGGGDGLRGYPVAAFMGNSTVTGVAELRTVPLHMVYGGRAALQGLCAASGLDRLGLHPDAGVGRIVVPQAQRSVIRIDAAWPFRGRYASGVPRLTATFGQFL